MEVGAVQVGFFVPRGRRQHDVGVQRRRVHPEVQVDDEIHLPDGRDIVPLHLAGVIVRVLCYRVGVRAQVVLQAVLVPLHAPHDGVPAPDVPHAGEVVFGLRIAHRVLQFLALELVQYVLLDTLVVGGSLVDSLFTQLQRVLVELRVERHPPHANGFVDLIGGVLLCHLVVGHRVVLGELPVVAILARVDVVPDGRLLEPDGVVPVLAERNRRPGVHRRQLFLSHVVVEAATVLAHTTGEHQSHRSGPVHQVGVVPVVDARPYYDHALAAGGLGGARPLTGELEHRV